MSADGTKLQGVESVESLPLEMLHRILVLCDIADVLSFSTAVARPALAQVLVTQRHCWASAAIGGITNNEDLICGELLLLQGLNWWRRVCSTLELILKN